MKGEHALVVKRTHASCVALGLALCVPLRTYVVVADEVISCRDY